MYKRLMRNRYCIFQVATQTHPASVVVPQTDVGPYTQFALQNPQQQLLQQNELSIWPMGTPTPTPSTTVNATKSMPGGIAKKAIDKQSRKDRRCVMRQTPAGSQGGFSLKSFCLINM